MDVGAGLALPSSGDGEPSPYNCRFCGSSSRLQNSGASAFPEARESPALQQTGCSRQLTRTNLGKRFVP